jgi:hypothetical protein
VRIVVYGTPAWADRFWSKVDKSNADGCWLWIAAKDRDGYGSFWLEGKQQRAHRLAFALLNPGVEVPDGLVVRHECDNPTCVRHLLLGTPLQNDMDRVARGRSATGDLNGSRKYPERLVRGAASPSYRPNECRNGHPIEKRYVSSSGERRCTECQRQRRARYRAKQQEAA